MEKNIYNINGLIEIIKDYSLSVHKLTFRYGIDYVKCHISLKDKYPEIFKELEEYFIPRKVIFKYYSDYPNKRLIECGNNYELSSMIGIPKCDFDENINGETIIKDLEWVLLKNLTENEISEYKDKLILSLNIVNYD